jgi:hypothetical protein
LAAVASQQQQQLPSKMQQEPMRLEHQQVTAQSHLMAKLEEPR